MGILETLGGVLAEKRLGGPLLLMSGIVCVCVCVLEEKWTHAGGEGEIRTGNDLRYTEGTETAFGNSQPSAGAGGTVRLGETRGWRRGFGLARPR